MTDPSRRQFIKLTLSLSLLPFVPSGLLAENQDDTHEICVMRNGQCHTIKFIEDGQMLEEEYFRLCYVFKDVKADTAVEMDIELFKIISKCQKWLAKYGYTSPIILTSAYRTISTNASTEGAAHNSMHLYGKAADLKYPGLPVEYLAALFRSFGAAGIGIYSSFLHIDTWKERVWRG